MSRWVSWCGQRKNSVRVVEADVPAGIMPAKINASLIDIKIGGKRGPDDALYNKSQVMNDVLDSGVHMRILKKLFRLRHVHS